MPNRNRKGKRRSPRAASQPTAGNRAIGDRIATLEETTHLRHLTPEGLGFLHWTTAPFEARDDDLLPRVPDVSSSRTCAALFRGTASYTMTAGDTIVHVVLCPNSANAYMVTFAGAVNGGVDLANPGYHTDNDWAAVKAKMATTKSFRVVAGGLRMTVAGTAAVPTPMGNLRSAEGNLTQYDDLAFRTPNEIAAGFSRYGSSYPGNKGIMARKLYEEDFHALEAHNQLAALEHDRLFLVGTDMTSTCTVTVEYVLAIEYRPAYGNGDHPTFSPFDFHYQLLRAIALSESDIDHTANSLSSILARLKKVGKRVGMSAFRGGAAASGGGPTAAALGAATGAGQELIKELVRMAGDAIHSL